MIHDQVIITLPKLESLLVKINQHNSMDSCGLIHTIRRLGLKAVSSFLKKKIKLKKNFKREKEKEEKSAIKIIHSLIKWPHS